MRKIPPNYVGTAIAIGILCALAGWYWYERHFKEESAPPTFQVTQREGFEANAAFWQKRIAKDGGVKAYADFKRSYASSTVQVQHVAAHSFGGALYRTEGDAGLGVCDNDYSYGCFHEFLGHAIEENGSAGLNDLNQACFEALGEQKALACTHGLGHGIQSHLGYTLESLKESLRLCAALPYTDPIGGCSGGVFMEFNMRTMRNVTGMGLREPERGDMQWPCNKLAGDEQKSCYFWQPQWWYQVEMSKQATSEEAFVTMGKLCRGAIAYNKKCFEGIGNTTPPSADFSMEKAVTLCRKTSTHMDEYGYCLSGAAMIFYGEAKTRDTASTLCEGLAGEVGEYCRYYSTGEYNRNVRAERKPRPPSP